MTTTATPHPIQPRSLAARACAAGLCIPAIILLALLATGLVPAGERAFVLYGAGAAAFTGATGITVLAYLATLRPQDGRLTAERVTQLYLIGLVGNLLLQFVAVGIGVLAVFWIDEKFASATAFGLAFASTATLLQTGGSIVISRALRARSRQLTTGVPAGGGVENVSEARDSGTS